MKILHNLGTILFVFILFRSGGRVVGWSRVTFQCWGVLIWIKTGQGPITFEVGAEEGRLFVIITFLYLFSPLSPCL